jgi:hypothetical protein
MEMYDGGESGSPAYRTRGKLTNFNFLCKKMNAAFNIRIIIYRYIYYLSSLLKKRETDQRYANTNERTSYRISRGSTLGSSPSVRNAVLNVQYCML